MFIQLANIAEIHPHDVSRVACSFVVHKKRYDFFTLLCSWCALPVTRVSLRLMVQQL